MRGPATAPTAVGKSLEQRVERQVDEVEAVRMVVASNEKEIKTPPRPLGVDSLNSCCYWHSYGA
jgi:hypothetical protein